MTPGSPIPEDLRQRAQDALRAVDLPTRVRHGLVGLWAKRSRSGPCLYVEVGPADGLVHLFDLDAVHLFPSELADFEAALRKLERAADIYTTLDGARNLRTARKLERRERVFEVVKRKTKRMRTADVHEHFPEVTFATISSDLQALKKARRVRGAKDWGLWTWWAE